LRRSRPLSRNHCRGMLCALESRERSERSMNIRTIFITRYVDDHDTAIDWYSQLFGRRPDDAPVPDCREWNLQTGVVFQVIRQPERAGEQSFAFGISDFQ